jgi:hypothetical protein
MDVTKAWDGEECLDAILSHGPGYFSVVVVSSPTKNDANNKLTSHSAILRCQEWTATQLVGKSGNGRRSTGIRTWR